jgi:serine/threonine protein phosphatase PrpC
MNVHSTSLIGKRPTNEDGHTIILNLDGHDPNIAQINLFCIFDGHGGNRVSKLLKDNFYKFFQNKKLTYPVDDQYIKKVFDYIQDRIIKINSEKVFKECGSTCICIIEYKKNDSKYLQIINLGDCRAVLCRNGIAVPLTKDHKPTWLEEKMRIKEIDPSQPKFDGYDWRVLDLSVSRAFGDVYANPLVSYTPDIFHEHLRKSDRFIIIACDGLWDVLSNQDAVEYVLEHTDIKGGGKLKDKRINIAKKIADHAIQKGSSDNLTAIIAFF